MTEDTPKPLVIVDGKPILAQLADYLEAAGVDRIYIITWYLADEIKAYLKDEHNGDFELCVVREQKSPGTCGIRITVLSMSR